MVETLEQRRPCVVLAESGGAAYDIFNFCTHRERPIPTQGTSRRLTPDYVRHCEEVLVRILKVSGWERLLTFFKPGYDVEAHSNRLDQIILNAVLSDCKNPADAIM